MALDFMSFVMGKSTGSGGAQPSGNIGYQVTFKVDDSDYYIVSCQQGESITEPPLPTLEQGKFWVGWQDSDGNIITFPYIPSTDIELNARITTYNFLVANNGIIANLNNTGDIACKNLVSGNGAINGDYDICAYGYDGSKYTFALLITKVSRNSAMIQSYIGTSADKSIVYNGTTYYYAYGNNRSGDLADTSGLSRYKYTSGLTADQAALEVLNACFGITE